MKRLWTILLSAVALLIAMNTVPPAAYAGAPTRFTEDLHFVAPVDCDYPASLDVRLHYQGIEFYDDAGNLARIIQHTHHVLVWTNLVTGYQVTALLARTHILDEFTILPDGSTIIEGEIRGLNGRLVAPGQGVFVNAVGRFTFHAIIDPAGNTVEEGATLIVGQDERADLAKVCDILRYSLP